MQAADYAGWAAVRSVGEAAARTQSGDAKVLRDYIRSPNSSWRRSRPQPELSRLERRIAPADADCPAARLGQPVAARGFCTPAPIWTRWVLMRRK